MNASYQQTKTAYRRMVARYHPDRLGRKAQPQAIKHAESRMIEMRNALETIEAHLGV